MKKTMFQNYTPNLNPSEFTYEDAKENIRDIINQEKLSLLERLAGKQQTGAYFMKETAEKYPAKRFVPIEEIHAEMEALQ